MITIYLKQFALTGEFGPVKLGMSKTEVLALLGKPDGDIDLGKAFSSLQYGWYEFFFIKKTGTLESIQNDHLQAQFTHGNRTINFKNDTFEIDPWFVKAGQDISRKEVKNILRAEGLSFAEEESGGSEIIRFDSGITLDFDNRDGEFFMNEAGEIEPDESVVIVEKEEFVLNGMRYFPTL
ncbi:MAG: hypothetical protein AAF206_04805 [Bacteroidota bacterium]